MKKFIAVLLTLAVCLTFFCVPVSAASYSVKITREFENGYTYVRLKPSTGTVYYTTDGSKPDRNDKKYKTATKIKITKPCKLRLAVYSGGKVRKNYSVKIDVKNSTPKITFTKASSGKYTAKITVPKNTTVYYTTNGKTPSKSTGKKLTATKKITVKGGTKIKALAVRKGWKNSSVIVKTAPKTSSGTTNNSTTTTASSTEEEYMNEVLRLVNIEREKRGISKVVFDSKLNKAAKIRSDELIEYYDHVRPSGKSCFTVLDEMGIYNVAAAENIAAGYVSPADVVNGWMNSSGHRRNILNSSYKKMGIGYSYSSSGYGGYKYFWAQLFTS